MINYSSSCPSVNLSILSCPNCGNVLSAVEKSFKCINNHNFDKSKYNYLNLLLANHKNSLHPGDTKEMTNSRFKVLNEGYCSISASKILNKTEEYFITEHTTPTNFSIEFGRFSSN